MENESKLVPEVLAKLLEKQDEVSFYQHSSQVKSGQKQ